MILTFLFNNVFYSHYVYKIKLNQTQKTMSFKGYEAKKQGKYGQIFFWLKSKPCLMDCTNMHWADKEQKIKREIEIDDSPPMWSL